MANQKEQMANSQQAQHNALKIAVIEEQIYGLRAQQNAHYESALRRFDHMEQKLDKLTAALHQSRGALAAASAIAACVGALMLQAAEFISHAFWRGNL